MCGQMSAWLVAGAMMATGVATAAQTVFPDKPIRMIVPSTPGGGTDLLARLLSKRFYEAWGQVVTVDNRPGAGGNLGAEIVAKSPPDGYTLLMSTASTAVNDTIACCWAVDSWLQRKAMSLRVSGSQSG